MSDDRDELRRLASYVCKLERDVERLQQAVKELQEIALAQQGIMSNGLTKVEDD